MTWDSPPANGHCWTWRPDCREEASVVLCRIGQLSHLPTQTTALGLHNSEVRSTDGFLRSSGTCYEFSLQSAMYRFDISKQKTSPPYMRLLPRKTPWRLSKAFQDKAHVFDSLAALLREGLEAPTHCNHTVPIYWYILVHTKTYEYLFILIYHLH
jgi:hypothetical protein